MGSMPKLAVSLALVCLLLVACVEERQPSGCDEAAVEVTLSLSADRLEPSDPAVCAGQEVTLVVESEVDAVLHVHGYDEALPASEVTAGETTRLEFTAERAGQFPIEIHPLDAPEGVEVGILTVHEG